MTSSKSIIYLVVPSGITFWRRLANSTSANDPLIVPSISTPNNRLELIENPRLMILLTIAFYGIWCFVQAAGVEIMGNSHRMAFLKVHTESRAKLSSGIHNGALNRISYESPGLDFYCLTFAISQNMKPLSKVSPLLK